MKTPKSARPKTIKDAKKSRTTKKAKTREVVTVIELPNGDPAVEDAEWLEKNPPKTDFKAPSLSLLAKLGSVAVHADELLSPNGHAFDRSALQQLLRDPEVMAWIKDMGPLLPRKRSS